MIGCCCMKCEDDGEANMFGRPSQWEIVVVSLKVIGMDECQIAWYSNFKKETVMLALEYRCGLLNDCQTAIQKSATVLICFSH